MVNLSRRLNATQVLILKLLASNHLGLTRKEIEEKLDVVLTHSNVGPRCVEDEDKYPTSLRTLGLVRAKDMSIDEDERGTRWFATQKGVKLCPLLKTHKIIDVKIPPEILDPAVKDIRLLRSYGLETFNSEDLAEIRSKCGPDYVNVSDDSLRQQINNRRKQGAFADRNKRSATAAKATIKAFGPDGTVQANLLPRDVLKRLYEIMNSK